MQPFKTLTSCVIPLPHNDVDTDQIIPASYLKGIDKTGLAEGLFFKWRYLPDGSPDPDFPLNQARYQGCQVLLAGDNFGNGSSREHAPWALTGWGIRAVISTSFADIFRNNALKNSLLPLVVDAETHRKLFQLASGAYSGAGDGRPGCPAAAPARMAAAPASRSTRSASCACWKASTSWATCSSKPTPSPPTSASMSWHEFR